MYEGEKGCFYEAADFNRVVAGTGYLTSLCKAKDCDVAYAATVVPRPRS